MAILTCYERLFRHESDKRKVGKGGIIYLIVVLSRDSNRFLFCLVTLF